MRSIVLLIALALPCSAGWSQNQKPEAKEAKKPAAQKVASERKSRRSEDARHCLEKTSNTEVIKCAEAYL